MTEEQLPYHERLKLIKLGKLPKEAVAKKPKPIARQSEKKKAEIKEQKEAGGESGLDKYFDYHMKNSFPKCENCGMVAEWLLEEKYAHVWRGCQAHVLRKKDNIGGFPSVASNLTNHLVLFPGYGKYLCGCHDLFDSSYEAMAKMAVFPKAIDIINQLYPFIAKDERKYLPEIITQEIKPEIYAN
jgi:hypothetical protein